MLALRMKKAARKGATLVVADPRKIWLTKLAKRHLQLRPGSDVWLVNAMMHVILKEGLQNEKYIREHTEDFDAVAEVVSRYTPEEAEKMTGVPAADIVATAREYATEKHAAVFYTLGITEHACAVDNIWSLSNLVLMTGHLGYESTGLNALRGQNNVQGSNDMGSFPHEFPGNRHISDEGARDIYQQLWGRTLDPDPGLRIPNMFDAALGGTFRGLYIQGEDIAQSDPNTQHVEAALRAMDLVVVQDLFLNETARFAHVFLPGTSFLEKDGTFTNAERRINRVRPVFASKVGMDEWEITCAIGRAMGYEDMSYASASEIMDEVAATTPTFAGVSFARLDEVGSMQWPVFDTTSTGTPIMHVGGFVRGKGKLIETVYVPTTERSTRKYPLILTTGRILSQYNVGAQTRRTANNTWHPEDILEIHPADAEMRGISTGDLVDLSSRVGSTTLRASVSERMPAGVVYTTFHHPVTGANVVTTENSDWATNCPEYKVTAVEVGVANARGDAAIAETRAPADMHA